MMSLNPRLLTSAGRYPTRKTNILKIFHFSMITPVNSSCSFKALFVALLLLCLVLLMFGKLLERVSKGVVAVSAGSHVDNFVEL